jgi:hypothetical protein
MLVYSQLRLEGCCDISLQSVRRHYEMLTYRAVKTPKLSHNLNNKMRTYIKTTERIQKQQNVIKNNRTYINQQNVYKNNRTYIKTTERIQKQQNVNKNNRTYIKTTERI